jgi:leishmanolysin
MKDKFLRDEQDNQSISSSPDKKKSNGSGDGFWDSFSSVSLDGSAPLTELMAGVSSFSYGGALNANDVRSVNVEDFAKGGNGGNGGGNGGNGGGEPGVLDKYTSGSNDGSGFNIEINFKGTWTVDLQQDFIDSSEFLSDTIVGDLADVFFRGKVIDDIRIDATLEEIDGEGGILGQAGATAIRTSNSLPATAIMEFDIADATNFDALDLWDDIILHEMTHSIGFSAGIWELIGGLITGNDTSDPLFTGAGATSVYKSTLLDPTGINGVPLEAGEGTGTDFSHWDEETFDDELMTGFINSSNVYSDMTVAALEDMGYDTVLFDSGAFL